MTNKVVELYNQICLEENCSIELSMSGGQGGLELDVFKSRDEKLSAMGSDVFYDFVSEVLLDYIVDKGATGDSLTCSLIKDGAIVKSSNHSWDFEGLGSLEDILNEGQFKEVLDLTKDNSRDFLFMASASSEASVELSELVFEFADALPPRVQDYLKQKLISHLSQFDFDLTSLEVTCTDAYEIFEIEDELTIKITADKLHELLRA